MTASWSLLKSEYWTDKTKASVVVVHTFRPSARKQRLLDHKFEANLVYRGRSRTARTIQRNKTKKVTSEYPGGKRNHQFASFPNMNRVNAERSNALFLYRG